MKTPARKTPIVSPASTTSWTEISSSACCGPLICIFSQVDLARRTSAGGIPREALPDRGREKLDPPQILHPHPAQFPQSGLGARLDLRVAAERRLLFRADLHPRR